VPEIRKLADEASSSALPFPSMAATDEVRNRIMPVNRKYPLRQLLDACLYYQQKKARMITFEYILIAGVNDAFGPGETTRLCRSPPACQDQFNPLQQSRRPPLGASATGAQEAFFQALQEQEVNVTLRREKGHDIDAACGQLRLRTEREFSAETASGRLRNRRNNPLRAATSPATTSKPI